MKTQTKRRRGFNSVPTSRWMAYATAAAASGFAMAHTLEAAVHYSGLIDQKIGGNERAIFHLGSSGAGFSIQHRNFFAGSSSFGAGGQAYFVIYGVETGSVNGVSNRCERDVVCVSNLERGAAISGQPFVPRGGFLAYERYSNGWKSFGNFLDRGIGLVGFRFNDGAGDRYGWVRVRMRGGSKNLLNVIDYAYGDPGDFVSAGEKSDNSAPGMQSLGGLALGAAGLLARRQRLTK